MPDSKRVVGKSLHYRSIARTYPHARVEQTRFETVAALNIKPSSRQAIIQALPPKIFSLFAIAILILGLYEFFTDDWFFVSQLQAQGLNYLQPLEVERASGTIGYNVFFIEPNTVERALRKMPEIKSAQVMLGIPNTVFIQIEE